MSNLIDTMGWDAQRETPAEITEAEIVKQVAKARDIAWMRRPWSRTEWEVPLSLQQQRPCNGVGEAFREAAHSATNILSHLMTTVTKENTMSTQNWELPLTEWLAWDCICF